MLNLKSFAVALIVSNVSLLSAADWSASQDCDYQKGAVETIYRQISNSVPHKDLFYPSCSRYIRDQIRAYGPLGFVTGFGRWSMAHLPSRHYEKVVVNGEIRLFSLAEMYPSDLSWDGFDHLPKDCSETSGRVVRFISLAGLLPESW